MPEETLEKISSKYCVYTELDCLLDTRLELIKYINPNGYEEYLKGDKYWYRIKDNIANIPSSVFHAIYKHRSKMLLKTARPTGIINMLKDLFIEMRLSVDAMTAKETEHTRLYINIYPYNLTDNELSLLSRIYSLEYGEKVEIVFLYKSPTEITPLWIAENVNTFVMYNGIEWLNAHIARGNVYKSIIMDRMLITPYILPTTYTAYNVNNTAKELLTDITSAFVTLQLVPITEFCSDIKYSDYERYVDLEKK